MAEHITNAIVYFNDCREVIKQRNLARWEILKAESNKKCSLCSFPLDTTPPIWKDQCDVCSFLVSNLSQRTYWIDLNSREKSLKRRLSNND